MRIFTRENGVLSCCSRSTFFMAGRNHFLALDTPPVSTTQPGLSTSISEARPRPRKVPVSAQMRLAAAFPAAAALVRQMVLNRSFPGAAYLFIIAASFLISSLALAIMALLPQ